MADWTSAFRYAFRTLRRQPTFALVALLTLALGIGANTAIFSVIKTVVLNPLPYESPEKIAILWEVNPDGNQGPVSVPTFEDWKREAKSFESLAAYRHVDYSFQGTGDPQNVPAVKATPDLFNVLKSQATLGADVYRRRSRRRPRSRRRAQPRFLVARVGRGCIGNRQDDPAGLRSLHGRRRDAAGVRIPDQHQCGSVDAAGVRSERHARSIAPGAVVDGCRPDG